MQSKVNTVYNATLSVDVSGRGGAVSMLGKRFGRGLVVGRANNDPNGQARWIAVCDCDGVFVTTGRALRSGNSSSCGCLWMERLRATRTHGHAAGKQSPEYNTWASMHQRCRSPNHTAYKNYGGRGIFVCARWNSFQNFLADMGERPSGHWIQPWPGEAVLGEVVSISGDELVCAARGGLRFTVRLSAVRAGRHLDHGKAFNGSLVRYRLSQKACAIINSEPNTRRDIPLLSH